jgi:hypothetical protein
VGYDEVGGVEVQLASHPEHRIEACVLGTRLHERDMIVENSWPGISVQEDNNISEVRGKGLGHREFQMGVL